MDVLEPSQHLVQEELVVLWSEVIIGLDDLMQVGLQQLKDDKDIPVGGGRGGEDDVLDLHNVWAGAWCGEAQWSEWKDVVEDVS